MDQSRLDARADDRGRLQRQLGLGREPVHAGKDGVLRKVVGPLDGLRPAALHGAKLAVILGVG